MTPSLNDGAQRFSAALSELEAELDWSRLGEAYCHEGGRDFFCDESIAALRETGLLLAGDVADGLAGLTPEPGSAPAPGRSLYIGAALAELPLLLCESLVLGRSVHACSLPGPEPELLNAALSAVSTRLGFDLPRIHAAPFEPDTVAPCNHVWLVSVLTDPEAFPALHDELYERGGGELATGKGHLPEELVAARRLLSLALDTLELPALVSTTDEELIFLHEACAARGWLLSEPQEGRLSGIVGDPVRCHLVSPVPTTE